MAPPRTPTLARLRATRRRERQDCRRAAPAVDTLRRPWGTENSRATQRPAARGSAPADCDRAPWTRSQAVAATASGPTRSARKRIADPATARGRRAQRTGDRRPAGLRRAPLHRKPTCGASCSISRRSPERTALAPPRARDRAQVASPREGRGSALRRATPRSARAPRRRRRAMRRGEVPQSGQSRIEPKLRRCRQEGAALGRTRRHEAAWTVFWARAT